MRKWKQFLAVAAMLMTIVTSAMATAPSKTTGDLTRVRTVAASGAAVQAAIQETLPPAATESLAAMTAFVTGNQAIAAYFAPEVQASIAALLPPGMEASTLTLSEFISMSLGAYTADQGDVTIALELATVFEEGQTVIVMVGGMNENNETIWVALPATVVDGALQIVFPSSVLQVIGSNPMLAVLSTAVEEQ